MVIDNLSTYGWEAAIRGMRNSRQSWDKSDSAWFGKDYILGKNDKKLASDLAQRGVSHAKFRRMIGASMDITAPLYWWKEFDTYKIGTVANSTSTMYSIMNKEFTTDDFEIDTWTEGEAGNQLLLTINTLNHLRDRYLNFEGEDTFNMKKMYWRNTIQLLPSSYKQMRTVALNYEVLSHMVGERLYHRLDEWQEFCRYVLANLPYAGELIYSKEAKNERHDQNGF